VSIRRHDRQIAANGGTRAAAAISEALFEHDSHAAIAILEAMEGATDSPHPFPSWRMRAALVGADALFDDFAIDLPARLAALEPLCDPPLTARTSAKEVRAALSEVWRRDYRAVSGLLAAVQDRPHIGGPLSALTWRADENRPLVQQLGAIERGGGLLLERQTLAARHVRLSWDRLLLGSDEQLIAAEVMRRAYSSRLARARSLT
jgi:hypothetical protein